MKMYSSLDYPASVQIFVPQTVKGNEDEAIASLDFSFLFSREAQGFTNCGLDY